MRDLAILVNALTAKVRIICPDVPGQLREAIRTVVVNHCYEHRWVRAFDGTLVCECGAWK